LIAPNLGVDIATTATQGVLFTCALGLCWLAAARGRAWPRPLEAAGASLIVLPYLLAFALRSRYTFENLRNLGWYDTLPQVGLVLLFVGCCSAPAGAGPGAPQRPGWRALFGLVGLVLVMFILQRPRVEKQVIAEAPALTASEQPMFPIPELQRLRARYLLSELADWQRLTLIRLELAADEARRVGIGREAIRRVTGRVTVPDWPASLTEIDGLDLFPFPPDRTPDRFPALSEGMLRNLAPVAQPRPPWLPPTESWPPG
jgi:hypothetical protein